MKFRVRYARTVFLETIVEAESAGDVKDDGSLPSVYTNIPRKLIPAAVDSVEDYEGYWEVKPAWDQMPEELLNQLSAAEQLTVAAEIVEPHWEDDYVTAAATKGDPSYSILDFARDIVAEALDGIGTDDYELERVIAFLGKSPSSEPISLSNIICKDYQTMELVIDYSGTCRLIYDDMLDLDAIGNRTIRRASHVEPTATGDWRADLSPIGGPMLGPFTKRSDALVAEFEWLTLHWLLLNTSEPSVWLSQSAEPKEVAKQAGAGE